MNRQFQNRLVGTIVLVALGVIFLPDLLDGKKSTVVEEFTEIPLRPNNHYPSQNIPDEEFEVLEVASVDLGDDQESSTTNSTPEQPKSKPANSSQPKASNEDKVQVAKADSSKSATIAKPQVNTPKVTPEKTPVNKVNAGYTIQLGGFNNAQNVEALVAKLRLSGYTAYTLPDVPVDGKLTRVFVGPEISESKLAARKEAITKLTGLKGKIVAYDPLDK
ncbi:cell division protein DedD [Shewanella gaetbuli]|uniref:Cell division protein DedD n=1 Tax=Shewanella gaetbuli TaxID=220752 RepID=A0A9X1ZLD3_9GAMM|nr:cell division protein DedD [Shewanella gaetbuli]MCL1143666.1 cell division protein DedD [Shewanella gaetbuli]